MVARCVALLHRLSVRPPAHSQTPSTAFNRHRRRFKLRPLCDKRHLHERGLCKEVIAANGPAMQPYVTNADRIEH